MYWKDKSRWKSLCLCNNYVTSGIYCQFHTCCTHIRKPYVCAILPWWGNFLTVIQWNFMWQCWTVLTMLPNSKVENPSCSMKRSMKSIGQLVLMGKILCLCNNNSPPIVPKVYFTTEVGASKIQKLKLVSWNLLGGGSIMLIGALLLLWLKSNSHILLHFQPKLSRLVRASFLVVETLWKE